MKGFVRSKVDSGQYRQTMADRWFHALNERRIRAGTRCWVARVVGIHCDGREIWIQITRGDSVERSLVLHLSGWTTIDQAITAMRAAIGTQSDDRDVYPWVVTAIPTV